MSNITAIIVVKGNPEHLGETLDSIKTFADEILIGDIGIDKKVLDELRITSIIRIIEVKREVAYVELVRDELQKQATHEYVLVLDPDEIVPQKLIFALRKSMGEYDYVKIPRKNIIFGKWIQHSRWWPDYQVRFFKKGAVSWPKIIHAQPATSGKELILEANEEMALIHYNYKDLNEYLSKASRYAAAEAAEDIVKGEPATFKFYSKKALSEFVSRYFAHDGYKDGMHGFTLAFLQMMYYFLVYFYVLEERKFEKVSDENILKGLIQFFSSALYETTHWSKQKGLVKISLLKSKLQNAIHKLS
ncbi:hypothetical protein A3D80_01020 [Candidatus Roizmanbacteria bacterium RIFCSPHIGHO2_02_FULL_40_13b]|uniref:Glycosyltransferase 2-like domain-containing protein n=1 Tax=Candidatus Roizmanbacteria bacterium RIFCSPHIGHO2_01_FULL_39_24 TaxID=1802032 RepID=A0A1F7GIQ3_9BACT|nr:MAG: hypothetical protein A2799_02385 [Candidatus Roizmanbacteria bacterium RIFCSPHIGHO2_01_FULL_39_24]OGK26277.1 MAG: hypothetical protein A3D80_01020 [Candidatus Roizmanbacteria bacterium RIFCSPHIGHO2_02_FULL_40_13b]OGK48912.1 MAG: hypothetical protein A3A56_01780 [Candidatus Roizmanbacteria bacterium RIFCSPLOWO2_01_FULL_40_32]